MPFRSYIDSHNQAVTQALEQQLAAKQKQLDQEQGLSALGCESLRALEQKLATTGQLLQSEQSARAATHKQLQHEQSASAAMGKQLENDRQAKAALRGDLATAETDLAKEKAARMQLESELEQRVVSNLEVTRRVDCSGCD